MKFHLAVVALAAAAYSAAASCNPTFPKDWSAIIINEIEMNQGGQKTSQGLLCSFQSPECKVQTAYQVGHQFFDFTNQRSAFKAPDNSGIVTLFKDQKEYQVDANGNCQAYCPIDFPMIPLSTDNATDKGQTTYAGRTAELFQTVQVFPILNITMETDDFYVDCSNPAQAEPIADVDYLTPFGESIGSQNQTWVSFEAGPQDANNFVVNGAATCQESPNCGQSEDASARLLAARRALSSAEAGRATPLMLALLREQHGVDMAAFVEAAAARHN